MQNRDQEIISLTQRYRLATNATIHRHLFVGKSINAVTKVTSRLCREGMLQRYPLIPPEDYFTLGPYSAKQLGLAKHRTEPLGPQALPTDYAVLLYASMGERVRLADNELLEIVPWLPSEFYYAPHCKTAKGVLELIRVDLGGSPYHLAKKCAADYSRRLEHSEFRELLCQNRFQLVVLTTTQIKARLIRQSIESMAWEHAIRLHLAIIPRLAFLHFR